MAKTFSWNKGQSAALGAPRDNLLVSAAAGSGKTAVLTERIFRLLTRGDALFETIAGQLMDVTKP